MPPWWWIVEEGSVSMQMTRTTARKAAKLLALGRAALGAVAVVAPSVVARPWVGETPGGPATGVLGRGLGGRDLALGMGALLAMSHDAPVRGWLEAGALADLTDALATAVNFQSLPPRGRRAVLALAASGAGAGALLARKVDAAG